MTAFRGIDPLAKAKVGDEIVYGGHSYFFVRKTPAGDVMAPDAHGRMLEIPDSSTGFPKWPSTSQIVSAMKAHQLFLRSDPLSDPVRAEARLEEHSPADVWHRDRAGNLDRSDAGTELRDLVVRQWDALSETERPSLGDKPIREWIRNHPDMGAARAAFGRIPSGSTARQWIRHRGQKDDRRAVDMPSRRGKVRRRRKVQDLVLTISRLHALAKASGERPSKVQFTRFKNDVAKANQGKPVVVDGKELDYTTPTTPLKPFGLTTFRLECRKAKSAVTEEARRGKGARKQNYGGGGHAQEPVRYLQIVQQDDTPLPKWFLIDAVNRVPVGPAAGVFTFDVFTNVFPGWDVSLENPSQATWMRALAHTAIPKPVPAFLADEFPELRDLYGYVTGEVLYDNALQNIARAVEDAGGDLAHSVRVAGEKEPTHKGKVERAIQTVQGYIKEIPSLTLPIAQMRRFGYDPRKHVVVTVDQFRTMLDEAIQTYHTQPSDALGGRSPLQVWLEQVAIHGHHQPKDLDQFLRSIGEVHHVTFDRTGASVNGLNYSAGTSENEQLLSDFAASQGGPPGDALPSFTAKVKSYDTCSVVSIFNPLTRRYVELRCTMRRYARDLPVWLHHKIVEFAKLTGKEFRTEEQMEQARERFSASLERAIPEATARQVRNYASVVDAPNVRRFIGTDVVLKTVSPSANGMGEGVVLHDARALTRKDTMGALPRPKRGGANATKAAQIAAAEQRAVADLAAREVENAPRHAPRAGAAKDHAANRKRQAQSPKKTITAMKPGSFR